MRHKELEPPGQESDGGKTLRDDCDEINRRIIIYNIIQCEVHVNITMHSHDRVITSNYLLTQSACTLIMILIWCTSCTIFKYKSW